MIRIVVPQREGGPGDRLLDAKVLLSACGEEPAILTSLLEALIPRLETDVGILAVLHRARKAPELREAAHSLCEMVAICSTRVADLASELEDCAADGQMTRAGVLIAQLESTIAPLIAELAAATVEGLRLGGQALPIG